MGLFVDLISLSESKTNAALELMCKAAHDDGDAIWDAHPSPFVRRIIELFTQRGLMRLGGLQSELAKWLDNEMYRTGDRPARPDGAMERWTPGELALVRLYLETLPPDQWALDDHMMLVDFLVQRYLPADDLRTEAEWLVVRSNLMGRVQANMDTLRDQKADAVMAALPATEPAARAAFAFTPAQSATLDFARTRAAENVRKLADDARHRMRSVIAEHVEQQMLGTGAAGSSLQTKLLDEFATLNRDWRRIAVTEAGEAQNQGFVASLKPGSKVKRVEQYRGICAWCAKIDGRVMRVVDPSDPDKDGETDVWVGKNNVGRSAAPRKRIGAMLVDREPHELYWPAAGLQHPHCRGRWIPTIEERPGDDPEFAAWLREHLGGKP